MTLETRLLALVQAIGADVKALFGRTVPPGGSTGQVLTKTSAADYATVWQTPSGGSGGGVSQTEFDALEAEIVAARGDRSSLGLRISNVSNFASPNAGGNIVGQFYDNAFHAAAPATLAWAANRLDMAPFFTSQRMRIDQIGVGVATAGAGAARCVIYDSTPDGWPDDLVLSASITDTGTVGYAFAAVDFTFDAGRQYWLGLHTAGAPTIRAINLSSAVNLGVSSSNGTSYFSILRRTVTYASGAPATWNFLPSDRQGGIAPVSMRMRAAALA